MAQKYESMRAAVRTRTQSARRAYFDRVLAGREPYPTPNKNDTNSREMARLAALARWGKEDPKYLAFADHFYKKRGGNATPEPEEEESEGPEEEDEE